MSTGTQWLQLGPLPRVLDKRTSKQNKPRSLKIDRHNLIYTEYGGSGESIGFSMSTSKVQVPASCFPNELSYKQ